MKHLLIAALLSVTLFSCEEKTADAEKTYSKDKTYEDTYAGDFTQKVSFIVWKMATHAKAVII